MKKLIYLFLLIPFLSFCQNKKKGEEIHWMTWQEAVKANEKAPKKMLIDVYTEWCGWCKKMDKSTYEDKNVVKYINANYYAVKMDAEMEDTIQFNNHTFTKTEPGNKKSPHQLAVALLNGKMGYPSTVFLDEKFNMLTPVQGYLEVDHIEMYLKFFGQNIYSSKKWEEYENEFKSEFVPQE